MYRKVNKTKDDATRSLASPARGFFTSIECSMKTVLLTLALLTAATAQSAIYKCGNGVFSDKACPNDTGKVMKVYGTNSKNKASIDFRTHLETYKVHGQTYRQVNAAMHKTEFQAFARWAVAFTFDPITEGKTCTIDNLNIGVAGIITMPEWVEYSTAEPTDRNQWDKMYSLLKQHEDGHVQHGKEFSILLREKLLGIGPQPCNKLQSAAEKTQADLHRNLDKRDEEYDRRTMHGLRQFDNW